MAATYTINRNTSARGSLVKLHDSVDRILRQKGSEVYSISPDATVYEALETLEERNVGALLVMAGDSLVGLLSERDYVRKVKLKGHSSTDLKVEEIMSTPVVTVSTDGHGGRVHALHDEQALPPPARC